MKITIFSFDLWGFNKKIADELISQGHEVRYVNSADITYKYPNIGVKFLNFFSKNLLKKNIKRINQRKLLIETIRNSEKISDITFMVNPGFFPTEFSIEAKKFTKKLIAYNYDSLMRVPLPENYDTLFDKIYCFDDEDVKKYGFEHRTNFNYISNSPIEKQKEYRYLIFTIQSVDQKRMLLLDKIANILDKQGHSTYKFLIKDNPSNEVNKNIEFIDQYKSLEEVEKLTKESKILLDLIREDQAGLSFRFYEAMAYQKKIITTNKNVLNYDFYNSNNILIIDQENIQIPNNFLNSEYEPLANEIFKKYTLKSWVKSIF